MCRCLFVVDFPVWLFVADVVLCQRPLAMLFGTGCTVLVSYIDVQRHFLNLINKLLEGSLLHGCGG